MTALKHLSQRECVGSMIKCEQQSCDKREREKNVQECNSAKSAEGRNRCTEGWITNTPLSLQLGFATSTSPGDGKLDAR